MKFKPQTEILTNLIDYTQGITSKLTDFNVGSAVRSIYDATSIEMESLYALTIENINEGIEEGLMSSFGFFVKSPQAAYGKIVVEFNTPVVGSLRVPKGTAFVTSESGDSNRYLTTVEHVVPGGVTSYTMEVTAEQTGAAGNVSANKINKLSTSLYNVARVYNPLAFTTGNNGETYEEVRKRFALFIESIGRATKNSIKYGALSVKEISSVYVTERVGLVTVYAADQNGDLSTELGDKVYDAVEPYRPAGIELRVLPLKKRLVDVNFTIVTDYGKVMTDGDLDDLLTVVQGYLNQMPADENLVVNDLIKTIINFDDIVIYDVNISAPLQNIVVDANEIIRAGKVSIRVESR